MQITTTLSCGDKAWTFEGDYVRERTVGQVRIEYTHSAGIGDGFMEGGVIANGGENYEPMEPKLVEQYMCVETGIGSGSIFTLGESIFLTREECETANAERIAIREQKKRDRAAWERSQLLAEEASVRMKLARIEAAKSST